MGCDEIKPPEVPELDTSKLKGNLPVGKSLSDLKAPVSKSTLSDSLKGAGGLITSNAKKLGDSFSPDAIAGKIGDAIEGIAGSITSRVDSAVNGLSNLKDRITGFDPAAKAKSFVPNSPEDTLNNVKGKVSGASDAVASRAAALEKDCGKQFAGKASAVGVGLDDKIKEKTAALTPKERVAALKDPEVAKAQKEKIIAEVKEETKQETVKTSVTVNKEVRTVQTVTQADGVTTVSRKVELCPLSEKWHYMEYMIFLHGYMLSCLRDIQVETNAIINYISFPKRFPKLPTISAQRILGNTVRVMAYRKLMTMTIDLWKNNGCGEISSDEPASRDVLVGDSYRTILRNKHPNTFGGRSRVWSYDNAIRTTGTERMDQFFRIWNEEFEIPEDINLNGSLPKIKGYENVQPGTGTDDIGVFSNFSTSSISYWWKLFTPVFSEACKKNALINKELGWGKDYAKVAQVEWEPDNTIFVPVPNFSANMNKSYFPHEFMLRAIINYEDPVTIESLDYVGRNGDFDPMLMAAFNL